MVGGEACRQWPGNGNIAVFATLALVDEEGLILDVDVGVAQMQELLFAQPGKDERGEQSVVPATKKRVGPRVIIDELKESERFVAGESRWKLLFEAGALNSISWVMREQPCPGAPAEEHLETLEIGRKGGA